MSRSKKYSFSSNIEFSHAPRPLSFRQGYGRADQAHRSHTCLFRRLLAKSYEGEPAKVNSAMLENFLEALTITGAEKKLERIILTAGAKQYGLHLGQSSVQ